MIVETKIIGRRSPFERKSINLPEGEHTLLNLLKALVREELTAYDERQRQTSVLRVLTEKEIKDGAAAGRIQIAPQEKAATVTLDEAIQTAIQGFRDGLYYVFVDDEQIEALDMPVTLRPDSTLLLLRLTALAGG